MAAPSITFYPPGSQPAAAEWTPGDFLLTRNTSKWYTRNGFVSGMIRLGERLELTRQRVPKAERAELCQWNHAVAVSRAADGSVHLVEAAGRGVIVSPLDEYRPVDFMYVHTDLDDGERADAVATWERAVGVRYGFVTDASIGLEALTGCRIRIKIRDTVICSGLVAAGLGVYEWRLDPSFVRPDMLAAYHGLTGQVIAGLRQAATPGP